MNDRRGPMAQTARGAALVMGFALAAALSLADAPKADTAKAARQIESACVTRGEAQPVCACKTKFAQEKLDPKVFAMLPELEPLAEEKDQFKALAGLLAVAQRHGIGHNDLIAAYQTIKSQRAAARALCEGAPKA